MPLLPGTRLGVYQIIASIGEGGMGAVFRARDTQLNVVLNWFEELRTRARAK